MPAFDNEGRLLVNMTGNVGLQGDTGVGDTGSQGDTGVGDTGSQGDTGVGDTGQTGDTGIGDTGEQGDTGVGDTGIQGDTGQAGDTGVGDTGEQGDTGQAGDTGVGDTGEQGDTGQAGDTGVGDTGEQGDTGQAGDTGAQGDTGVGDTGIQGDTGATGSGAINQYSITIEDPVTDENICMGFTFVAITVTEVQAVLEGTSNGQSVTIDPWHGPNRDGSGGENDILNVAVAITSLTTGQNLAAFDDPTIPADSWIILKTTAKAGTVIELTVTIRYTID